MNSKDLLKGEVGSSSKRYATSTVDGNEANDTVAERVLDITEEGDEGPMPITAIKTEPNNGFVFVECGTGSCNETCVTCDVDGTEEDSIKVEEGIGIQNVMPEAIKCPPIKTEIENSFVFVQCGTGSCSETCVTCDVDGTEEVSIKDEEAIGIKNEIPEAMECPPIKTEIENSFVFVECGTGSCSEKRVTCDVDGTEEVRIKVEEDIDIKDEMPEAIECPPIKTEIEGTLNVQLQVHSDECGYSYDIPTGERPYLCEVCNKAFSIKNNLIIHKRTHSGERPYVCEVCSKSFSQKGNLMTHQRIHSGERPYSCEVCKKAFSHKVILIRHQRIHSAECPYTCKECNKAFKQKITFIRHQRIHSGECPYICEVCSKPFIDQRALIKHKHMHSGERPYTCDVCNMTFSLKSNMTTHKRIHSGECPYTCDVCNKTFIVRSGLIRHLTIHSGEHPYNCELCNKAFSDQSSLRRHKRIHSGECPYACEVCNKAFSQKVNLIRHRRIHSGVRPYVCAVCNKAFSRKNNLIAHLRIHSGESPDTC